VAAVSQEHVVKIEPSDDMVHFKLCYKRKVILVAIAS